MKYPAVILRGRKARGEVLSIALANEGQHQDTGAKMMHAANETTSNVIAKSISIGKGRSSYRGWFKSPVISSIAGTTPNVTLYLSTSESETDTYPAITVKGSENSVQHEASVSKVSAEQIFYMQQRGMNEGEAMSLCVNGFVNDLIREFPMEYSVELKRLIDLKWKIPSVKPNISVSVSSSATNEASSSNRFSPPLFSTNLRRKDHGNQVGLSISARKIGKSEKLASNNQRMIVGAFPQSSLGVFESVRLAQVRGQHFFRKSRSIKVTSSNNWTA